MTITRRYHFSASHRLHTPALSEAENELVYGKCNNPFGHGHDYVLEVCLSGPVDAATGLIVPIPALDEFVNAKVLQIFAYRNLNVDVPYFQNLVPTTENVARVVTKLIQDRWPEFPERRRAHLQAIRLQETERNSFEIVAWQSKTTEAPNLCAEEITVHV